MMPFKGPKNPGVVPTSAHPGETPVLALSARNWGGLLPVRSGNSGDPALQPCSPANRIVRSPAPQAGASLGWRSLTHLRSSGGYADEPLRLALVEELFLYRGVVVSRSPVAVST